MPSKAVKDLEWEACWGRIAYYFRLTSYAMAMLAFLSLGRAICLYGLNVSSIKMVFFIGWLIGAFVIFPTVIAIKKILPRPKKHAFIQKADRFNDEILGPCFMIVVFIFISLTTWKAGDFGKQAGRYLEMFFDVVEQRGHISREAVGSGLIIKNSDLRDSVGVQGNQDRQTGAKPMEKPVNDDKGK